MAMTPTGGGPEEDALAPLSEINVTPFVDVMLVLLIVFMVAAPMMVAGVPVNLPRTDAPRLAEPREPLVVTLTADGVVRVGEQAMGAGEVVSTLAPLAAEAPDRPVLLRADRSLSYGEAMTVLGALSRAGFSRVSLLAEMPR
ncbi:ExbD/TolR family protein [Roseococcus suduntuyensis]|uniref:Biopolymer transport protein ExbD n=1 Tax=Roseococcus suduntuyensis TaxID=455361 RepID=A0A840AFD4_9PROT|nr:ExbD/TolR family protein [Roseococcus suduntuyensis]MBB3899612.1 biopolymer transport protein ExbD [Roseococcus suduntuyensis]